MRRVMGLKWEGASGGQNRRRWVSRRWPLVMLCAAACCLGPARDCAAQLIIIDTNGQLQIPVNLDIRDLDTSPQPPFDETDLSAVVVDPRTKDLVAQLDAPDYARRETVTAELLGPPTDLLQLRALLARPGLAGEQRYRLLEIVRHRLIHTPRGALGISMQWQQGRNEPGGEIEVMALIDDMPARNVLRVGDRIRAIDGQPLLTPADLVQIIQNKRPGDHVRLTVRRPRSQDGAADEHRDGQARANAQPRLPARPGAPAAEPEDRRVFDVVEAELNLGSADQLNGLNSRNYSPVLSQRQALAESIRSRYAPQVRPITVPSSPLVLRGAPGAGAKLYVDDEPVIQSLISDLRSIAGGMPVTAGRRQRWQSTLEMLNAQLQIGHSDEELARMRRIAERYAELIPH